MCLAFIDRSLFTYITYIYICTHTGRMPTQYIHWPPPPPRGSLEVIARWPWARRLLVSVAKFPGEIIYKNNLSKEKDCTYSLPNVSVNASARGHWFVNTGDEVIVTDGFNTYWRRGRCYGVMSILTADEVGVTVSCQCSLRTSSVSQTVSLLTVDEVGITDSVDTHFRRGRYHRQCQYSL